MRVLVALSYSPYPVTRGTDRLIMNLLTGLSRDHRVRLVTMSLSRGGVERLREIENDKISVRAIIAPHRKNAFYKISYKMLNIIRSAILRIPLYTLYASPEKYLKAVGEEASKWDPDIVLVNYWHLFKLAERLENVEKALITHDLDFRVQRERFSRKKGLLAKVITRMNGKLSEKTEARAYRIFDRILTVTERDALELRRIFGDGEKIITPLPMAIDMESFDPSLYRRENDSILFMGAFESDFNRDALEFFLSSVFPRILETRPGARLEIVGSGASRYVGSFNSPGVIARGKVEDVIPYLGRCSVMVLPLRFGGGVRVRMLEAAAMGTPVVSTPIGVEGLGLNDGEEYIEAKDEYEFSRAVIRVLQDGQLAERLSGNARRWAEKQISLSTYPDRLNEALGKLTRESISGE